MLTLRQKLVVFLTFFLVISVIFPLVLYYYSVNVIRSSIVEKNNAQAEFFVEAIDSQVATAEEMSHNILFDRKLSYLIVPNKILSDYELMQSYLAQQERLKHLLLSSPLVETAVIFLPNLKQKITDNQVEEMTEEDFEKVKVLNQGPTKTIVYSDGQLYMTTSGMYYNPGKSAPDLLFAIRFSPEILKNYLNNYNVYPNSFSLFQINQENIIMGNEGKEFVDEWLTLIKKSAPFQNINKKNEKDIDVNGNHFHLFSIPSKYFGTFYHFVPTDVIFAQTNQINYFLIIYLLIMLLIAVFFSMSLNSHVHRPLNTLVERFKKMESGNLEPDELDDNFAGREFDYVFKSFNEMKLRLNTLINELYIKDSLVQLANLKQLQSQINPHFLYNSFFSLSRKLKRGDTESASQLAEHLGTYFRFLGRPGSDTTTLEKEVIHARSYTNIQEMRFSDRITVEFEELPEQFNRVAVPRLILQPIIENAFKYGLENLEENGLLSVCFIANESNLVIRVEDNGQDLSEEVLNELIEKMNDNNNTELTGLVNIHKRLKIFFGDSSGLSIERNIHGGLTVSIILGVKGSHNESVERERGEIGEIK